MPAPSPQTHLLAVAPVQLLGLVAIAPPQVVDVALDLLAQRTDIVVEAVPRRLAADPHRLADGGPAGPVGHRLLDEGGLPRREVGPQGAGGPEGDQRVRLGDGLLPGL